MDPKKKEQLPETSQDERAPQDESPVTTPARSDKDKSEKTYNDPVEKERRKRSNNDNGQSK